ncbi:M949_RS01915 family surface polysaccharide biosynthesis protein [Aerolutibacter ruishenii]|uniref:M949_RS01915 family surface polysaccharide biosynthesis protein n=1 Tax=Aerolutibacter ruishenii TaxID=686800 RepID=UPI0011A33CED|nr:hypothetical protein [Lysobacter ruishenii]
MATRMVVPVVAMFLGFSACTKAKDDMPVVVAQPLPVSRLDARSAGEAPERSIQFRDAIGWHVLALSKSKVHKPFDEFQDEDVIRLSATLYRRDPDNGRLGKVWEIRDSVSCVGLDIAADFFHQATSVTDLDGNGRVEVTVAYRMFCGGGVDPKEVKVIMREGGRKYALRGESRIEVKGQAPYGGQREKSRLPSSTPKVFVDHLEKTWRAVYIERPLTRWDGCFPGWDA